MVSIVGRGEASQFKSDQASDHGESCLIMHLRITVEHHVGYRPHLDFRDADKERSRPTGMWLGGVAKAVVLPRTGHET